MSILIFFNFHRCPGALSFHQDILKGYCIVRIFQGQTIRNSQIKSSRIRATNKGSESTRAHRIWCISSLVLVQRLPALLSDWIHAYIEDV